MNQDEVVRLCKALVDLTDNPYPGLATWNIACANTAQKLKEVLGETASTWKNGAECTVYNTKPTGTGKHYPKYVLTMCLTSWQMDSLRHAVDKDKDFTDRSGEVNALLTTALLSATIVPYKEG